MVFTVRGSLPEIIRNDEKLYEGDLIPYFRVVFHNAQNLQNPYHNFRHIFHVVWLCYQACLFYRDRIPPHYMRNLLIAAIFHDFNHPGLMGDDDLNIARAVRGLRKYILSQDVPHVGQIEWLIKTTEYPYKTETSSLQLESQIIRDADMGQSLAMAWIQQVIFGLAGEWGKPPIDILKSQIGFLKNLKFYTDWGQNMFPQSEINAKIKEVEELIKLLE